MPYRLLLGALVIMCFFQACKAPEPGLALPGEAPRPAKNIIFLIGDGMGLPQISAALYSNNNKLSLEQFPVIGFHKPYSASGIITDSAAGATAFACGVKTYNGSIGMDTDTLPCYSITEELKSRGYATGLIASSTIVHATPAAFFAHQPLRVFYEGIAADFLKADIDLAIQSIENIPGTFSEAVFNSPQSVEAAQNAVRELEQTLQQMVVPMISNL